MQSQRAKEGGRRDKAFTLVEICVVTAILVTLVAIGFSVSGPAREKGRQTICVSQLKQIYSAMTLYAADNPGNPISPTIDLPEQAIVNPQLLEQYGAGSNILYCPDAPPCVKKVDMSTYNWNWTPSRYINRFPQLYKSTMQEAERLGSAYPIVYCTIHDEMFYHPREADLNDMVNPPFVVDLHGDGSVIAHRRQMGRPVHVKHACGGF